MWIIDIIEKIIGKYRPLALSAGSKDTRRSSHNSFVQKMSNASLTNNAGGSTSVVKHQDLNYKGKEWQEYLVESDQSEIRMLVSPEGRVHAFKMRDQNNGVTTKSEMMLYDPQGENPWSQSTALWDENLSDNEDPLGQQGVYANTSSESSQCFKNCTEFYPPKSKSPSVILTKYNSKNPEKNTLANSERYIKGDLVPFFSSPMYQRTDISLPNNKFSLGMIDGRKIIPNDVFNYVLKLFGERVNESDIIRTMENIEKLKDVASR